MKKTPRRRTQERSAGGVIFHAGTADREILLLRYGAGPWGFPKGHVEPGETDLDAAQREITEETAIPLDCQRVLPGFRDRTDYSFRRGRTVVEKEVAFFLVESKTLDVRLSPEHTDYAWVPYEEALRRVTFEGPRRVLKAAWAFLNDAPRTGTAGGDAEEEAESKIASGA